MVFIEKKWNDVVECDVFMVMLCVNSFGGSIKINWVVVVKFMMEMGYDFLESVIM